MKNKLVRALDDTVARLTYRLCEVEEENNRLRATLRKIAYPFKQPAYYDYQDAIDIAREVLDG